MSRLVKAAGASIGRFGRSVRTRYAFSRKIAGLGRHAPVFRVDEQGEVAEHGVLHWLAADGWWLERASGDGQAFSGLPPFVEDMRPQGYMGRSFPAFHPELSLPARITDWNDDHQLIALANRGEEQVTPAWLRVCWLLNQVHRRVVNIPSLPSVPKTGICWSSLHAATAMWRTGGVTSSLPNTSRWKCCEMRGMQSPHAECVDRQGERYLEMERFDRVGGRGRRGVISLAALNDHFLGDYPDNWSRASQHINAEPT